MEQIWSRRRFLPPSIWLGRIELAAYAEILMVGAWLFGLSESHPSQMPVRAELRRLRRVDALQADPLPVESDCVAVDNGLSEWHPGRSKDAEPPGHHCPPGALGCHEKGCPGGEKGDLSAAGNRRRWSRR
jgi:hypothetical protein